MEKVKPQETLDDDKKRRMRIAILQLERDNVNTKSKTEKEMAKQISNIIEEEVSLRY